MERFVKGDVIVVPFPFTDLSGTKRRPALVVSSPIDEDVIVCQITTKLGAHAIALNQDDLEKGKLSVQSYIKPAHIFTIKMSQVAYKMGHVKKQKWNEVSEALTRTFAP